MGCGFSHDFTSVQDKIENGINNFQQRINKPIRTDTKTEEAFIVQTPERNLVNHAPAKTAIEKPIHLYEKATLKPKSHEHGAFDLPVGNFVDGQLGVTDDDSVDIIRKNIGYGKLYVDPTFPPNNSSLFFNKDQVDDIEWKRPREIVMFPKLFVQGANRKDVVQGMLGDCWFLSSCAAVAKNSKLIERAIPPNQPLCGGGYKGLIWCRFWRFGEWVTVCIDDYLPVKDGKPLYARCEDPAEFWVSFLEKAYAKLHGTYEAMAGGQSMDALVDLTGGLAERFDLVDNLNKKQLFPFMETAAKNGAFITCSRKGNWTEAKKADLNGLVEGHAYSITKVERVNHADLGVVLLIKIRNPWANEAEWNGEWSDMSNLWDGILADQNKSIKDGTNTDGEFWMNVNDFWKHFEEVSICLTGPDFDQDGKADDVGLIKAIKGKWIPGNNAGGSRNNLDKFSTNPQFLLTIYEDDTANSIEQTNNHVEKTTSNILIGLMQEHRFSKKDEGVQTQQIGVCVYKSDKPEERLPAMHFKCCYDEGTSGIYINYREVLCRLELTPGDYVIIPATFDPEISGHFMIRIYSSSRFKLTSLHSKLATTENGYDSRIPTKA